MKHGAGLICGLIITSFMLAACIPVSPTPFYSASPKPTATSTSLYLLEGCTKSVRYIWAKPGAPNQLMDVKGENSCVKIIGRNEDGSWVMIDKKISTGGNGWMNTHDLKITGNVNSLPIISVVEVRAGTSTPKPATHIPPITIQQSSCDPSYPTVCIPPYPPDLNCPDVKPLRNFKVLPPDPHGFDRDSDGWGCEGIKNE